MLWSQHATMFLFNYFFRMHFWKGDWLSHEICMYLRLLVRLPNSIHRHDVRVQFTKLSSVLDIIIPFSFPISTISNLTNLPRPKWCSHGLQCVLLNVFSLKALLYLEFCICFHGYSSLCLKSLWIVILCLTEMS